MLQQVFRTVDTSGDGRIQYGGTLCSTTMLRGTRFDGRQHHNIEFRDFVSRADEALWELFKSIDRNHNGEIDRAELKEAFSSAGITVPSSMLDEFLAQMDRNHDGVISYNEWR